MRHIVLFIFFPFCLFSQTDYKIAKFKNPVDEISAEIKDAENSLKKGRIQYWVRTEKIVCLSGIIPKKFDHQYAGISYKPTADEITKWKDWLNQNKTFLKYIKDAASGKQIIVCHNPKMQITLSNCYSK